MELRNSFLRTSSVHAPLALPHRRASRHITDSPLDGPLHSGVSGNQRGNEVQDLVPRAAHDIPEALVDEGSHGTLPVGAERVGDDTLAGTAAALIGVAPGANVPSVCGQRAALSTIAAVCVVRGVRVVFRGMRGSAWSGEGECDCGRGTRTYVALTFALGSEPPPAIVRYVVGGGRCGWWLWDSDEKAAVARGVAFAGSWRFDDFQSTCSVIGCTGCLSHDQRFTSLGYSSCAARVKQLGI